MPGDAAWKERDLARKQSKLVESLTTAMHTASEVGFFKLAMALRDRVLPLAHEEVGDATAALAARADAAHTPEENE